MGPRENLKNRPRKSILGPFWSLKINLPRPASWSELASVYQAWLGFITSQRGTQLLAFKRPKVSSFPRNFETQAARRAEKLIDRALARFTIRACPAHVKIATFSPFKGEKVNSFSQPNLRPKANAPDSEVQTVPRSYVSTALKSPNSDENPPRERVSNQNTFCTVLLLAKKLGNPPRVGVC